MKDINLSDLLSLEYDKENYKFKIKETISPLEKLFIKGFNNLILENYKYSFPTQEISEEKARSLLKEHFSYWVYFCKDFETLDNKTRDEIIKIISIPEIDDPYTKPELEINEKVKDLFLITKAFLLNFKENPTLNEILEFTSVLTHTPLHLSELQRPIMLAIKILSTLGFSKQSIYKKVWLDLLLLLKHTDYISFSLLEQSLTKKDKELLQLREQPFQNEIDIINPSTDISL